MANFVAAGTSIAVTAPSGGVTGGKTYKVGGMIGVAVASAAEGEQYTLNLKGVYENQDKATGTAWTKGDVLYWDDTAKKYTKTSTSNTLAGFAYEDAASGDATGSVLLSR